MPETKRIKSQRKVHIANTFVEWELAGNAKGSLQEAFRQHPVYLQLQFLPILYGSSEDLLFVSDLPPPSFLENRVLGGLHSFQTFSSHTMTDLSMNIDCWGASNLISKWAKERSLLYEIPDWTTMKDVNSKQFSFLNSPSLLGSELLQNEKQALQWIKTLKGPKVLKSVFGVSGRGHLFINETDYSKDKTLSFLKRQWDQGLSVIAEPWVERVFDFSTQWIIHKKDGILYCGATLCSNNSNGQYLSSCAGDEKILFGNDIAFLHEHLIYAKLALEKMKNQGYFGHVGIDAMVFQSAYKKQLHPIVEINARKTMGWIALYIQQCHFPDDVITLSYLPTTQGLLPSYLLLSNGKRVNFSRNLHIVKKKRCTIAR